MHASKQPPCVTRDVGQYSILEGNIQPPKAHLYMSWWRASLTLRAGQRRFVLILAVNK